MFRLFIPIVVTTAALALSACVGGSSDGSSGTVSASGAGNGPPVLTSQSLLSAMGGNQPPAGVGCGWGVASDPDKVNVAFPDSAAKYWVTLAPITPGTRLKIQGKFPDARYFSFNAYDAAQRPTDAIADVELEPDAGAVNSFRQTAAAGGGYTAYLQFGPSPTQQPTVPRARNTLYAGDIQLGTRAVPNSGLVMLIYRVYVSAKGEFADGGVGLPTLTVETADGSRALGTLPTCAEPPLPNLGGQLPPLGLNDRLLAMDYPNQLALDFPTAAYPPRTNRFYGLGEVGTQVINSRLGTDVQTPGAVSLGAGGFLSNIHNAYTTTTFSRRFGSLAVVRAKAPSFRSQAGVERGFENLRYWSLCGNEFATQRFTACSADFQTPLDDAGYFTVVISDPADRPANATAANGFAWLPWGPYADQVLIYRHMLENPAFPQTIQRVPKGTPIHDVMGDYTPVGTYCNPAVFTQSVRPADVFAACVADQAQNPPTLVLGR
ncbi:MAG TPA: hypothetical protein VGE55_00065 [Limnobacter sp.]|uniref:hypothetical protein n=1 Tax=Limnobacter sp. TaxID=2003368 RepID=UPI002ED867FD